MDRRPSPNETMNYQRDAGLETNLVNASISGSRSMDELRQRIKDLDAAAEKTRAANDAKTEAERHADQQKVAAAEALITIEEKIRLEKIETIKKLLQPFADVIQFLVPGHEHKYQLADGQILLLRVTEGKLLMMTTSSTSKEIPQRQGHDHESIISTPDVSGWQVITFGAAQRVKGGKSNPLEGVYHYSRDVLDQMRDEKVKQRWDSASTQIDIADLKDMKTDELDEKTKSLDNLTQLPQELLIQINEFRDRKATIIRKYEEIQELKKKYGERKHLKIKDKKLWLFFRDHSVYIFNTPKGGDNFGGYNYPLSEIESDVQVNPYNTMGDGFVLPTRVADMKADEPKFKGAVDRSIRHSNYQTEIMITPGKLVADNFNQAIAALDEILNLQLEEPN